MALTILHVMEDYSRAGEIDDCQKREYGWTIHWRILQFYLSLSVCYLYF